MSMCMDKCMGYKTIPFFAELPYAISRPTAHEYCTGAAQLAPAGEPKLSRRKGKWSRSPLQAEAWAAQQQMEPKLPASRNSGGAKANGAEAPCKLRPASLNLHLEPKLAPRAEDRASGQSPRLGPKPARTRRSAYPSDDGDSQQAAWTSSSEGNHTTCLGEPEDAQ